MSVSPPPKGTMYLFDNITPPLEDGSYRITASSDVAYTGADNTSSSAHYFDVVGPRFTLPPTDVAGLFPPRDAHGGYEDTLAHMAIKRRTLPWERLLAKNVPVPTQAAGDPPPPDGPVPWVALLLFEEGEYTLLTQVPLETVVPTDVFARLGSPQNITCDAVETDLATLESILPSVAELQLLAHVRLVNVDDRELNAAGGDGYYSVVVANRLPTPGAKCRLVLVSLEERLDLISADPPPQQEAGGEFAPVRTQAGGATDTTLRTVTGTVLSAGNVERPIGTMQNVTESILATQGSASSIGGTQGSTRFHTPKEVGGYGSYVGYANFLKVRLVALYTWPFTCDGTATFRELMQALNVAMVGTVEEPGHPQLTDTGHLRLQLDDRAGSKEVAWYRGPLVPYELTRDPLGPYHSADQARRATPETGAEDISYAAAFEVGRLLAVADARLAQELMRWRREAYKQSARGSVITALQNRVTVDLGATLTERLHAPLAPLVATSAVQRVALAAPPVGDPYGIGLASGAIGFNAAQLSAAWNLGSLDAANALLGGDAGSLGAPVATVPSSAHGDVTLGSVAAETASLTRLSARRDAAIANVTTTTGGV